MPKYNVKTYSFYAILFVILAIGIFLRLFHLGEIPFAVHQDELSNIYDGFCIAETGADRWGEKYPTILRAFGKLDYRPPMHAWLSALSIKFFGFSVYSGRLVSAVLGCISLVVVYLVSKRMAGKTFAILALLLTVLSPWHIIFSRIASEGTMLPPFFLISSYYLWQRAKDREYNAVSLLFLGICIGLGTNTYQASKLVFFLLTLLIFFDILRYTNNSIKKIIVLGICCLVGAGPQIYTAISMPEQFFSRAEGSMMAFSMSYQYVNDLLKNIAVNISPDFLFFSFKSYNFFSVARLLMVEFVFFYIGIFSIHKIINNNQAIRPIYFWLLLLIAILPSALTVDNPNTLRASSLVVLTPLATAAGIIFIYRYLNRSLYKKGFLAVSVALIVWNAGFFINEYAHSDNLKMAGMSANFVKACKKINEYKGNYDNILIEKTGRQSYIFIATYCDFTPIQFQKADKQYDAYGWDEFKKLDKFYFMTKEEIDAKIKAGGSRNLILLYDENPAYTSFDVIQLGEEKLYLYESGPAKLASAAGL